LDKIKAVLFLNWGVGLEILKTLHNLDYVEVILVVTKYKKDSRDKCVNAVFDFANKHEYKMIHENDITYKFLEYFMIESNTDVLITHAFMHILPKEVFSSPKYGSINIHPSLLPKYKGPSPHYWVIKNKEKLTGLTCHYIDEGIDTGHIIYQVEIPIEENETIDTLLKKQKVKIKQLLIESLLRIKNSNFKPIPQKITLSSYAPRPREGVNK